MWNTYNTFDYYQPEKVNKNIDKVYILNVDYGIAWNYKGGKYPISGSWFWSSDTTPKCIDNLTENNNLCILQSDFKNSKEAIDEMQISLKKYIHAIIGIPIYVLANIINNRTSFNMILVLKDVYPIITIPKITNYEGYNIEEVPWLHNNVNITSEKKLLIMMGQECSGKTTYARTLLNKGYLIISEPIASSIRRKNKIFVNILKEALINNKKGVVIDTTNPLHQGRLTYVDIAKELNIPSLILWVSRPGYKFNNMNNQKIPETILNIYSKNIQTPDLYDIPYIRII